MGKRHPNHRLVKIHRSYTVEDAAKVLGKHKNTVRNWFKDGLATIDNKRPMLILGQDLVAFIKKRRAKNPAQVPRDARKKSKGEGAEFCPPFFSGWSVAISKPLNCALT